MGKFYLNKIPKSERIRLIAEFYDAINCLKKREDVKLFFRDLLSPDEIAMLVRRIEVAILLKAGLSYRVIMDTLRVGADKIASVQKSLDRNGEGYDLVIKRLRKILKQKEKRGRDREKRTRSTFESLKKQYPGHFLLFNLLDSLSDFLDDDGKINLERQAEESRILSKKKATK